MPRTLSKPRPPQGAHLAALRQATGMSQYELAALVEEPQANIAFWERSAKPPRSDALPKLARALGVRVEELLLSETTMERELAVNAARRGAPTGKVRRVFEEVSRLPRHQQDEVVKFVSRFVKGCRPDAAE